MTHITAAFLAVIVGLFPIVNPLGMTPIFMRLTEDCSEELRAKLAFRVGVGSFFLMAVSLFVGSHILSFFGLTIPAVQVAGGLVVMASGWRLLQQGDDSHIRERENRVPDDVVLDRAFFPLTLPLTVGPGTISVAITLGAKGADPDLFWEYSSGAVLGVLAVSLSIFICYRFSAWVLGKLGQSGTDIFLRLSAFVLLCLGVQIVWNGYSALMSVGHS